MNESSHFINSKLKIQYFSVAMLIHFDFGKVARIKKRRSPSIAQNTYLGSRPSNCTRACINRDFIRDILKWKRHRHRDTFTPFIHSLQTYSKIFQQINFIILYSPRYRQTLRRSHTLFLSYWEHLTAYGLANWSFLNLIIPDIIQEVKWH